MTDCRHSICFAYPRTKIRIFSDIFIIFASWTNKTGKVIKTALKILWKLFVAFTIFVMASILLLQTPMVQTYVANRFLEEVSLYIDGKISFERIHFKPFSHLVLKNVVIVDDEPYTDEDNSECQLIDTLFCARYLIADFSLKSLREQESLQINEVTLRDARLNLVLEQDRKTYANTTNLTRIFRLHELKKKEKTDKEIFLIKKVKIENMTYTMKNYGRKKTPYRGGINWNDLEINDIHLNADDLRFKGGVMSGQANRLSFTEKSGYICKSMSGEAKVGNGLTHLIDFTLVDPWSVIRIPDGKLIYSNVKDFSDYVNRVVMDMNLANGVVDFKTISYFAPQLQGNELRVAVDHGRYYGTVSDFTLTDMDVDVEMEQGGFSAVITGRLAGIPDVMNTTIEAELKDCIFTTEGLSTFVTYWMRGGKLDIGKIAKDETFHLQSTVNGTLNTMVVNPVLSSRVGLLTGKDIRIDNILNKDQPITLSGKITTKDLDVGKFMETDLLGKTSLTLVAEAAFGGKELPIKAKINQLDIQRLNFYGYDYTDIIGEAEISNRTIDGYLACNDPNLNFVTEGHYGISRRQEDKKYDFYVVVGDADLNKINLDKRGKSKTRFRLDANFTKTTTNNIYGEIKVVNLWLENSAGAYNIGDILINSTNSYNKYKILIESSFANGDLTGNAPATEFIKDLLGLTMKTELPALFVDPTFEWSNHKYMLNLTLSNTQDILAWAVPGMFIADSTTLEGSISEKGRLTATLTSQRIAHQKQYLKDIKLKVNNNKSAINGKLTGSEAKVATIKFMDNEVEFLAEDNHIGVSYKYENDTDLANKGEFVAHLDFSRDGNDLNIDGNLMPSTLYLNAKEWKIDSSYVNIWKDGIKSANARFTSNNQEIHIHGGTSLTKANTLNLDLANFDISIINPILKSDLGIKGIASGNLQLTSPLKQKGILIDLRSDSTYFANCRIGQLNLTSDWDENFQRFNITATTKIDGRTALDARARFTPKISELEAQAKLDKVDVGYLAPILKNTFSDVHGYVSGEVTAEGPIDNLTWESRNTRIENGGLRVNYTNVPYFVDGNFSFSNTGLEFDNVLGRDRYTGTAYINGGIKWNSKFQNISYDIDLKCNEIEGVNLNDKQNQFFYGNVFATGAVTFKGPANDLVMNVEATTVKEGTLHVPVTSSAVSGKSNLLKFTEIKVEEEVDPYDLIVEKMESNKTAAAKFTSNLTIVTQPDVEAVIWIDKAAGHMLTGRGNGTLHMTADSDKFTITGDYDITRGSYKFVALGVVNRDFEIQDGSSIKFNGNILDSELDIDAMYKTKASIGTLIGDTTSVSNRRTVECKIKITDKLMNPRVQFGIEIPEIDPTVKSRVESALSTEDKVQKQFLSLLLSNSFLPDEQSGIVNNSAMLYSNVSEVMANQLNNILEKLDIPVDVGLNYQPNSKGNDVFDVDVSTHMFNNRVVVNGSVGNKQYTENAQTDVVGDLDIEIKLNQSGAFRLNVFSHSADSYTNYLDNSQRNGVGLTYQTEFSSFRQFIKNIFSSKDKRQAAKQAEENAKIDEEKVTIKID